LPPPNIEGIVPTLSVVIPHWPLDEETNEALRSCVSSFPPECERIVVVNDGTGYGHNVNIGLRLASGDYIGVVNNDCRLNEGDVYDLCVPDAVTSPLVIGERQGFGESLEPAASTAPSGWCRGRCSIGWDCSTNASSTPTGRTMTSSPGCDR